MSEPCFTCQAAHILECNERTARELADAGILKVTRTPNGARIYDRAQVEAVAAERRQRRARDTEERGDE